MTFNLDGANAAQSNMSASDNCIPEIIIEERQIDEEIDEDEGKQVLSPMQLNEKLQQKLLTYVMKNKSDDMPQVVDAN